MNDIFKKILILAPHTDDGEFGCGGTIARFIENRVEVFYVAFSFAEKSVPKGMPKDILKKEVQEATKLLGIPEHNLILFNYEVRNFPSLRQDILEDMIKLKKEIKPDIVFLPSSMDTHQDHKTISEEGFRAYKGSSILGYEVPWNNLSFTTSSFVVLNNDWLNKKIMALKCYKSQSFRDYATGEFIKALARTRGTQIGTKYAEAFEVIRWVI